MSKNSSNTAHVAPHFSHHQPSFVRHQMFLITALLATGGLGACSADPVQPNESPKAPATRAVATVSAGASLCDNTQRARTLSARVQSVRVDANPTSIAVGGFVTVQATAIMSDQSEVVLDGAALRGGEDGILTRDGGGFLAVGSGLSTISAKCGSAAGLAQVSVVAAPVVGDSGTAVATLKIVRFDGGSGTAVVSNGVPLIPGKIRSQDVPNLRVYVRGTEVAARVSELHGRFSDSTVRAVQVQFSTSLTDRDSVPASLRLVTARTALAFAATATTMAPSVAALPTDPAYLRQTLVAGRLPAYPIRGVDQIIVDHDLDYLVAHELDWTRCGALWSCGRASSYDRALMVYEAWARTGDPTYYRRASLIVKSYIDDYVAPNQSFVPPWQGFTTSVAINYLVTGDSMARVHVRRLAEALAFQVRDVAEWKQGFSYPDVDPRTKAKAFMAVTDAYVVGAGNQIVGSNTSLGNVVSPTTIDKYLTDLRTSQYASGCFCTVGFGNGQMNYMVGLLMQNLIRYNEVYREDARIDVMVKAAADYSWSSEWLPDVLAFKYASVDATYNGNSMGPSPAPDLNGFLAPAYAWLSKKYGAGYMTKYTSAIRGLQAQRNLWMSGYGKQFDEGFLGFAPSLSWAGLQ